MAISNLKFEEALGRLEEIVKALEKGDLPLEESLKLFEEGVKLSKTCLKMLDEAEKKVEILLADKDGKRRLMPFASQESAVGGEGPPSILGTNFPSEAEDNEHSSDT